MSEAESALQQQPLTVLSTRCLSLYRWAGYVLYVLYSLAFFFCEVVAGVLEIPTDAPHYDALLHQASGANSYSEWLPIASTLDDMDGFQRWRTRERSTYFSFEAVMRTIEELLELQSTGDAVTLLDGLHKRVYRSLYGINHHGLYIYRTGTKTVIHSYTSLVCFLLGRVGEAARQDTRLVPCTREVVSEMHHVYGSTALLLQGGVLAASAHLGVAKALYEAGLLPPVIYGSGSGALVATLVCCSLNLHELFDAAPLSGRNALTGLGVSTSRRERWRRLLESGDVLDLRVLSEFLEHAVGDVTFAEAYRRTGRVLNIPFTSAATPLSADPRDGPKQPVGHQLLNYLTAPDVVVRSAVVCAMMRDPSSSSSATSPHGVDGAAAAIEEPSRKLLARTRRSGAIVVYDPPVVSHSYPTPCGEHADRGAQDPVQRLRGLFSIRFCIVSDASLHGYLWRQLQGRMSPSTQQRRAHLMDWLRYGVALTVLSLACVGLKVLAWFGYEALARPSSLSMNAVLQEDEAEGVRLHPVSHPWTFLRLWFSPTPENMRALMVEAQREVWPRLEQLRMSMSIEQVLAATVKRLPAGKNEEG